MTAPCQVSAQVDAIHAIAAGRTAPAFDYDAFLRRIEQDRRRAIMAEDAAEAPDFFREQLEQFRAAPFYGNPL